MLPFLPLPVCFIVFLGYDEVLLLSTYDSSHGSSSVMKHKHFCWRQKPNFKLQFHAKMTVSLLSEVKYQTEKKAENEELMEFLTTGMQ
ncbi:hypothetical protein DV515_00015545 [Chloebia gouldiae]|uniref:Uncharacterized protein n=1 Tax=Chloebia gouldiae TaxID=44316 RepID=A0A3L8RWA0_CHLGU|nr:hypothetical protein DV515_00015545 [Chloebia gouldiae]